MNANELADACMGSKPWLADEDVMVQAAVMLRQQQAEIESLKDEVAKWKMSYENNIRFEDGYGHN